MRTPEEVVMDVESELHYPLGPNIETVLTTLVGELDDRYEDESLDIVIEGGRP